MLMISLRDLEWRRRRFLIAILATALVFGLTLLLTGASTALRNEPQRVVDALGADAWVVAEGSTGPFTSTTVIQAAAADLVAAQPGVEQADPLVYFHATVGADEPIDVNVLGVEANGIGSPPVDEGRAPEAAGEVLVDTALDDEIGDTITVNNTDMTVVGRAGGISFNFGTPTVYMLVEDAQKIVFSGAPLASAVMTKGVPESAPDTMTTLSNDDIVEDLKRPMKSGTQTIDFINVLLWIVAAGIIGSIVYLSALERTRDFAVLKATGCTNRSLLGGLTLQAVVLCALSAAVAAVLAQLLKPGFPFIVELTLQDALRLPIVAILVGLVASLAGLRRAVQVDPAAAFGGA